MHILLLWLTFLTQNKPVNEHFLYPLFPDVNAAEGFSCFCVSEEIREAASYQNQFAMNIYKSVPLCSPLQNYIITAFSL